jgi:hypothetical protein
MLQLRHSLLSQALRQYLLLLLLLQLLLLPLLLCRVELLYLRRCCYVMAEHLATAAGCAGSASWQGGEGQLVMRAIALCSCWRGCIHETQTHQQRAATELQTW